MLYFDFFNFQMQYSNERIYIFVNGTADLSGPDSMSIDFEKFQTSLEFSIVL